MKMLFKECGRRGVSFLLAASMIFSMAASGGVADLTLSAYAAAPEPSEQVPEEEQGGAEFEMTLDELEDAGITIQGLDSMTGEIPAEDGGGCARRRGF